MLHNDALETHLQALISQIPDVPVMVDPAEAEAVASSGDATLILGLPLVWFHSQDGQHTVRVNRLMVGIQLAKAGAVSDLRALGRVTGEASSKVMEALMQKLEAVDAANVPITEYSLEEPKPTALVARMDLLNAAARRLNASPRFVVAHILGRTLH